ncbi:MAG: hypothetical protein LC775_14020 [Acidobacteria bacterium]|nr:hypothetical protein [Acidobacteriota bacterium]
MRVSHECTARVTPESAAERLQAFIAGRRSSKKPCEDMECFERELHEYVAAVEREVLAEELARLEVDLPAVTIEGEVYRQVVRCEESYMSAAGPVRVMRSLYRRLGERERTVCPLELRAGMVEGRWTPLAARQAAFVVAHLTPQEGEDLFQELGNMSPSKSSLDRLPKQLSRHWEAERERFEAALREEETVPPEAVTVAVSLDGVMVPMKDGARTQKRQNAQEQGKHTCGPAGYQEVGCATLSFYDAEGERLSTVRFARMPEKHKATLKDTLSEEIAAVLGQRPDLTLVKLADGAKDNWSYLGAILPQGIEIIDFYHASEHLKAAFDAAYGENSSRSKAQFEKYRHLLRDEGDGVEKVIRALAHLRDAHPRKRKLSTELAYFRRYRYRMRYAKAQAQDLPIGSGVVEAACKTLATERMKRSGMRWRQAGGQAILTFRALHQSERFARGWKLLSSTYKRTVEIPENVVLFPKRPVH